jgi:hypothetical protein
VYKPVPVHDVETQFARSARLTCFVLAAAGLGLASDITNPVIWGLIFGGLTGVLNGYFLRNRLKSIGSLDDVEQAKGFLKVNYVSRLGLVVAVVFFASHVDFLSVYSVGAGLLLVPCLTVIDAAVTLYRHFAARDAVDKI